MVGSGYTSAGQCTIAQIGNGICLDKNIRHEIDGQFQRTIYRKPYIASPNGHSLRQGLSLGTNNDLKILTKKQKKTQQAWYGNRTDISFQKTNF